MSSPAASSETSSLSPPPDTLSSPSPEPESSPPSPSPPPPPTARGKPNGVNRHKPKSTTPRKQKSKDKGKVSSGGGTKIVLKLKQPPAEKEKKKPLAKPREPKIEVIPRSVVNNHDVPLIVLFRNKFRTLFSGTSELGPQDVEEGVSVEGDISGKLEEFVLRICSLIGNRRKNVERDQLEKVLQETVDTSFEKFGFRKDGENVSPLVNVTFTTLDWDGRLQLLRALVHWALLSSDAVRQIIDDGYKLPPNSRIEREELDINTGLGVLPLATIKGDNYYLVEGKDTRFRIYHETNPRHKIINISSVAYDKPSLLEFAEKLSQGGKPERELAGVIQDTIIARIEAAEQRRVKAEQAALRLATWKASAPVYNTRTRGKKVDYSEFGRDTDDEEDEENEEEERESRGGGGSRRSERNRGGGGEREVTEYTASGRMVKRPRMNGAGTKLKNEIEESEEEEMDWSVYSDKGETENDEDEEEGEEGEEEEYDIGVRQLVVKFKVDKERLKAVMDGLQPVNGTLMSPGTIQVMPLYHPQQSPRSTKPHQTPQLQYHPYHQSPPKTYPPKTPPKQNVGPTPYTEPIPYTGGSPPIPFRSTQLSPQPIPRPLPSQDLSRQQQTYQVPQIPPYQPIPQPSPYPVAQFSRSSPPTQVSPQPYLPQNGIHQPNPPSASQSTFPQLSPQARWHNQTVPSVSDTQPSPPKPLMWKKLESPSQQTWSAATFQPPIVNGPSDAKSENTPEQTKKFLQTENLPKQMNETLITETPKIPHEAQITVVNGSEIMLGQVKDGDPKSLDI